MSGKPSKEWEERWPEFQRLAQDIGVRPAARKLGISVGQAENYWNRHKGQSRPPASHEPAVDPVDGFRKALEGLEPIRLPEPKHKGRRFKASETTIVAGDFHAPLTDPRCEDILVQVITDLKPQTLVLNGDTMDLLAVSKYPKDIRHDWSLLDERVSWHKTLYRLHEAMAGHNGEIIETEANHSGNGVMSRWWRYLSERIGPLAKLPDVMEKLSYQSVFWPEWAKMRLVDHWEIAGSIVVLHGDIARKQAGYSANAMLGKWRGSLIHNHTHRMGFTGNRLPAFGSRPEDDWAAYENGCMCSLDCFYTTAPDWQQGFAIVRHGEGHYNVEQVRIRKGVANVGGLGGTYRAAA